MIYTARSFSGVITFTHPETGITYYVGYKGRYSRERMTREADNSYPAEWDLQMDDLPAEIEEFEELLRRDILEYESQMLGVT
jgi:hypothetical protein